MCVSLRGLNHNSREGGVGQQPAMCRGEGIVSMSLWGLPGCGYSQNHCWNHPFLEGNGFGTLVFQRENMHLNKRRTRSSWPEIFFSSIFFYFSSFFSYPPRLPRCCSYYYFPLLSFLEILIQLVVTAWPNFPLCSSKDTPPHPWIAKLLRLLTHTSP